MKNAKKFRTLFLAAVAAITVISLNAFKSETRVTNWYSVLEDGQTINPAPMSQPGEDCDATQGEVCAIQLTRVDPNAPLPATLAEAEEAQDEGHFTIDDEAFRD